MSSELLSVLLTSYTIIHALGSWKAIIMLQETIAVEKLAKSYGLDYYIKHKKTMYVLCILFSWLAYAAFKDCQDDTSE